VLPPDLAGRAVGVAVDLASRLADASRMQVAIARQGGAWQAHSLLHGHAGIALAFAELDESLPHAGWGVRAGQQLALAATGLDARTLVNPGLGNGLAGLGLAAHLLARRDPRLNRVLGSIDAELQVLLSAQADALDAADEGMPVEQFDVVSGLSGTSVYLLARGAAFPDPTALPRAIASLIRVISDARWCTPPWAMHAALRDRFPEGGFNCGLLHGIAGPLAVLAWACLTGVDAPGMHDAVGRVAEWLVEHQAADVWGVNWPYVVVPNAPVAGPARAGWCYGAPGVAAALWLAGRALHRDDLTSLAVAAIRDVCGRSVAALGLEGPGLCHGTAGLLQAFNLFGARTPRIRQRAAKLAEELLAGYEPESLLGYGTGPGLLEGTAGIVLALVAAARREEASWERPFLVP
jgi:lantibiotic biosynthesis protein